MESTYLVCRDLKINGPIFTTFRLELAYLKRTICTKKMFIRLSSLVDHMEFKTLIDLKLILDIPEVNIIFQLNMGRDLLFNFNTGSYDILLYHIGGFNLMSLTHLFIVLSHF